MKGTCIFLTTVMMALAFSCHKAPEDPKGGNKITMGLTAADSVSYEEIKASALVSSLGGNTIAQHGFCWGTTPSPDISGNHSSLGTLSNVGKIIQEIEGLTNNTKYFVRPYISYLHGTAYGQQIEATTRQFTTPTVFTKNVTGVTIDQALVMGEITEDGGSNVTKRGVCWNITGNPTLSNCLGSTDNGTGTGTFIATLSSLTENQQYYAIAYATNTLGTAYGEVKQFSTLQLSVPQVTTAFVTNITATSATCGGNVTSDGNGLVSARGVCWNTSGNPTLSNSVGHTTDGTGTGSFTSNLTGLNNFAVYYVTSYATNEKGTIYSSDIKQFFTENPPCGQMTVNHGGQIYHTVQIGTQCWLKENLNIGTRINGSQNQTNDGTIQKYCYDDNESNCNAYGGLYQWDEMMQYVTTQGAKGICPDGWHIPTDAVWTIMTNSISGESVAGEKMKSTHGWYDNGNGSNSSGFTALPSGYLYGNGYFSDLTSSTYIWSSTEYSSANSWSRDLSYKDAKVYRSSNYKTSGFSCRCLLD